MKEVLADTNTELLDARVVLQKNKDAQFKLCKELASQWEQWMWTVVREKSIYHTLNNFKSDVSGMLRGEVRTQHVGMHSCMDGWMGASTEPNRPPGRSIDPTRLDSSAYHPTPPQSPIPRAGWWPRR